MITLEYEAMRMTVETVRQLDWAPEEDAQLSQILRYWVCYVVMKNRAQTSGISLLGCYMRSLKRNS